MVDIWSLNEGSAVLGGGQAADEAQTNSRPRRLANLGKRSLDLLLAVTAIVAFLWLFALIAFSVALTSRGPILFRQRRSGLNGRVFTIYKFRTMTVVEDGDGVTHARRDDPRLTRVGALLRRTSLDEMPQVINILKGDMAVVGPRPHALAHDRYYGALVPRYGDRFSVRPGLTGLAQIRGLRGEIHRLECMSQRVSADVEYAASWSIRSDLMIIARTVPLLFEQLNAY